MNLNLPPTTITPATLAQLISVRAGQLIADAIPEIAGIVNVVGRLSALGQPKGSWHYGTRIGDDLGSVPADIPVALVRENRLGNGDFVRASGIVRVQAGRPGSLEFRLVVSSIFPVETPAPGEVAWPTAQAGRMTIERLKEIDVRRHPFPAGRPVRLSLIRTSSPQAQVAEDCLAELRKVAGDLRVEQLQVNMLNAGEIAAAIGRAAGDVVVMIRGGGDTADFEVFDHPRVVEALATKRAYRVVGLGHSGNNTLLDLVADFSAPTPGQAGLHVREQIQAATTPVPSGVDDMSSQPAPDRLRDQPSWTDRFWRMVEAIPGGVWIVVVIVLALLLSRLVS